MILELWPAWLSIFNDDNTLDFRKKKLFSNIFLFFDFWLKIIFVSIKHWHSKKHSNTNAKQYPIPDATLFHTPHPPPPTPPSHANPKNRIRTSAGISGLFISGVFVSFIYIFFFYSYKLSSDKSMVKEAIEFIARKKSWTEETPGSNLTVGKAKTLSPSTRWHDIDLLGDALTDKWVDGGVQMTVTTPSTGVNTKKVVHSKPNAFSLLPLRTRLTLWLWLDYPVAWLWGP